LEEFIQAKVAGGASIVGVYPPDAATLAEYEAWRKERPQAFTTEATKHTEEQR
jgi:hypothetical protein